MNSHTICKTLIALGLLNWGISSNAGPTTAPGALLERAIQASAGPGDLVALVDGECRYVGQLVREAPDSKKLGSTLTQAAGGDAGRWHIDVTRRICRDVSGEVKLRADLPKPPSMAGGGGIPPLPYGYEAGTRFELIPN